MSSLTLVGVVFKGILTIPERDGRFLHNRFAYPRSDCWRCLGLTPATQQYKVCLYGIKAQEFGFFYRLGIMVEAGNTLLEGIWVDNR